MRLKMGDVTRGRKATPQQLPTELGHGATLLARFVEGGIVREVQRSLPLSRRGGFGSVELFASAVLFLCAGAQTSLRAFFSRLKSVFPLAAAIVDRRTLPSSASLSRALSGLDAKGVGKLSDTLLAMPAGLDDLLKRPDVQHRDAHGEPWHVFDFDPSTRAYRQRELVEGDEFPGPTRRAEGVAGHVGRKRGEIRQQDHLLRHAGSGLWAYYRLNSDGGSAASYLAEAASVARRWIDRIGHPADRALLRADGEFGHLAALAGCARQGLKYLTRIARYHLFDRPEVIAALERATWRRVPGSERKEAAELGTLVLHDSEGAHEPVPCRVVVTRFATDRDEPSHGVLRHGYQFETFATTLEPDAWPAEDVAALYAGRAGIENGFAQHDRAYDIDRTFSYSAAGQQFFIMVALLLWNEHVCIGAAGQRSARLAPQPLRPAETTPAAPPSVEPAPAPQPPAEATHPATVAEPAAPAVVPEDIRTLLREAAGGRQLLSGWAVEPEAGLLRCPQGNELHVCHAEVARVEDGKRVGQSRITLRTAVGVCDGCPLRATCFASIKQNTYKMVTWAVATDLATRFRDALRATRAKARTRPVRRRTSLAAGPPTRPTTRGQALFTPPADRQPGRFQPQSPRFGPARTHTEVASAMARITVDLRLTRRGRGPPRARQPAARRLRWKDLEYRAGSRFVAEVTIRARRCLHRMLRISSE